MDPKTILDEIYDSLPQLPNGKVASERYDSYDYDQVTGRIRWIKDSYGYKLMRSVFLSQGIDIDSIETEVEYFDLSSRYDDLTYEVVCARVLARKPINIGTRVLQALVRGDMAEVKRLQEQSNRRKTLGLRVVGGATKPPAGGEST